MTLTTKIAAGLAALALSASAAGGLTGTEAAATASAPAQSVSGQVSLPVDDIDAGSAKGVGGVAPAAFWTILCELLGGCR